ncbi:MAG: hypothetical protein ACJA2W_001143 [Planctomycetota bacterium]
MKAAAPNSIQAADAAVAQRPWRRRLIRFGAAFLALFVLPPALYFGAAEITMRITVKGESAAMEGSIDVYFFAAGPHVDLWVPSAHPEFEWREHLPPGFLMSKVGHLSIGWGDRAFYTQVPTWSDLTPSIAVGGALWPTPSTVRITSYKYGPLLDGRCHQLRLDPAAYLRLCEYILASAELDAEGRMVPIDFAGYGAGMEDRFFEGRGSYHLFHTCNSWTNGALKAAGKKSALWAPMPRGVRYQLPPAKIK